MYDNEMLLEGLELSRRFQPHGLSTPELVHRDIKLRYYFRGAAIAQWICLCLSLSSCRPRFESQAHHLHFHQFIELCNVEKTKINRKVAGIGPFLKNNMS